MAINHQKKTLRPQIIAQRQNLSTGEKAHYDAQLRAALAGHAAALGAQVIHVYLPLPQEVNLRPLYKNWLAAGKTLVASKTLPRGQLEHRLLNSLDHWEKGLYQTQHPAAAKIYTGGYDLVVVPGLAFTPSGQRLGFGGGYYDRFLASLSSKKTVAVAYPFQLLDHLPMAPHDEKIDKVIAAKPK
jgi:5-formyltetrahydrofolate cyclo-ligase